MRTELLVRQTTGLRAQVATNPPHLTYVTERTFVDAESFQVSDLDDAAVGKWGVPRGIDVGKSNWFECGVKTRM
ncbi:hypothetical protein G3M58_93115 [Streptomyces sp. SID7499]|uniref:Uncharacterized protein n=1 Tax=Streptomyces sp. SID7499 TaxID=2706086 RepID=A0A6G3XYV8_9ACTN|nr:hypothetical protein [Streptomyces sp. SID7499]